VVKTNVHPLNTVKLQWILRYAIIFCSMAPPCSDETSRDPDRCFSEHFLDRSAVTIYIRELLEHRQWWRHRCWRRSWRGRNRCRWRRLRTRWRRCVVFSGNRVLYWCQKGLLEGHSVSEPTGRLSEVLHRKQKAQLVYSNGLVKLTSYVSLLGLVMHVLSVSSTSDACIVYLYNCILCILFEFDIISLVKVMNIVIMHM